MTENQPKIAEWEQQPNERAKGFKLFCTYRDLGAGRTLEKVHKTISETAPDLLVSMRQLAEYSSKYCWVKRCAAWDNYLDDVARTEQELAAKDMIRRQADNSKLLQDELLMLRNNEKLKAEKPTSQIWAYDKLTASFERMAKLERLNRGEPTPEFDDNKTGIDELAAKLQAGREKARKETEERS